MNTFITPLQKPTKFSPRLIFLLFLIVLYQSVSTAQNPVDISFQSLGNTLKGKFYAGNSDTAMHTIILLHGFPGNETDVLGLGKKISQSGFNVLTFNYSGTHGSEGRFALDTALWDIKAAFDFVNSAEVVTRFHIDSTKLILGGYSFGGGMALTYAASHPEVHRVFSIAGTDHGEFAREYKTNQDMASQLDSDFEKLKRPDGPINFDGKYALKRLVNNVSNFDLRLVVPKLASRNILIIGGWDDLNITIENHLIPLYRMLKKSNAPHVKLIAFQADHSFRNVRNELATELVRWIQSSN